MAVAADMVDLGGGLFRSVFIVVLGGVVLRRRRYTPQQWLHRDTHRLEQLSLPSEEARRRSFSEACDSFARAISFQSA